MYRWLLFFCLVLFFFLNGDNTIKWKQFATTTTTNKTGEKINSAVSSKIHPIVCDAYKTTQWWLYFRQRVLQWLKKEENKIKRRRWRAHAHVPYVKSPLYHPKIISIAHTHTAAVQMEDIRIYEFFSYLKSTTTRYWLKWVFLCVCHCAIRSVAFCNLYISVFLCTHTQRTFFLFLNDLIWLTWLTQTRIR